MYLIHKLINRMSVVISYVYCSRRNVPSFIVVQKVGNISRVLSILSAILQMDT